ncbi:MAG TPA: hypothetical protein VF624_11550 [Tepidisphaeraceae bacterium]
MRHLDTAPTPTHASHHARALATRRVRTLLAFLALGWATLPATAEPLGGDASVDQALDALYERGKDLRSLAADVELESFAEDLGDDPEVRHGQLLLRRADGDTRLRIKFTRRTVGKRSFDERKDYVIDGQRAIERNEKTKKETTTVIGQPGDKLDLFKLGAGPFPLPIGQPRKDVLDNFDVQLVGVTAGKPQGAVVAVRLVPRKGTSVDGKFGSVTVEIASDGWPVQIKTVGAGQSPETNIARLAAVRANENVDESQLTLPPLPDGWSRVERSQR